MPVLTQSIVVGAGSTILNDNLTVSRAVVSNSSGKIAVSSVTSTELGYLSGVSSAIQTQFTNMQTDVDAKIPKSLVTTAGDIIYATGSAALARLAAGSNGQILKLASGVPSWANPAAGSDTYVQFNDGGSVLGGDSGLTYNKTSDVLTAGGINISGQTASCVAVLDSSKNVVSSSITTTELNKLDDLTTPCKTAWTTDTDGATVTFDLSVTNKHRVTLGGNRTLALSNPSAGQCFLIKLTQDGTGSRTVTWFSGITWSDGGTTPTLTTTASKSDTFMFIQTGTNTYDGFIVGQNI